MEHEHIDHSKHGDNCPHKAEIKQGHHHGDMQHEKHGHGADCHTGGRHDHAGMVADYKKRFWICLIITLPVLLLSPMIQHFLGLVEKLRFAGDTYILGILSSIIYFYGGIPFIKGLISEIKAKSPGMMTLIAIAITAAYLYSVAIVFGLEGMDFFWELATLIDIMLFGHWIEMKSVMGAGAALEQLVRLMPSDAISLCLMVLLRIFLLVNYRLVI